MSDVEPCNDLIDDDIFNKIYIIDKIIKINIDKFNTKDIMKKQLFIVNFIRRNITYFINDNLCAIIIKYFEWIMSSLWCICNRTNPRVHHTAQKLRTDEKNGKIMRSSYHFCIYTYECKNQKCDKHHFVFDLLYADVSALHEYLSKNKKYDIKEIMKSINTIQYVIKHMLTELKKC